MPTGNPQSLPFESLNLTRNPFGELPSARWAQLAVTDIDLDVIVRRLRSPGFAVELTGAQGHGKTTHMRLLHARFPSAPFVLVEEDGHAPQVPDAPLVFVDEVCRLPKRRRKQLFRREASFVLGTHTDHGEELARAGVERARVEVGRNGHQRLRAIIDRRIEDARRTAAPIPRVDDATLRGLLETNGHDVRTIFESLYDDFQRRLARAEHQGC